MFPAGYFATRYFPGPYWPKLGSESAVIIGQRTDIYGSDGARTYVSGGSGERFDTRGSDGARTYVSGDT